MFYARFLDLQLTCGKWCFEVTTALERQRLIDHFNGLESKNVQGSYLASLIDCKSVARRRSRQQENVAELHDYSYNYKFSIVRGEVAVPIQECIKAFLAVFGITESTVRRIRTLLTKEGVPPTDQRGKHSNRLRAFTEEQVQRIIDHIRSFRGRQSHYALNDTRRLFLPEEFNLAKMYNMYCEQFAPHPCSQESYR
ncbi:vitamin B12-dependent ribonucleotide reductase [Plakobranchus ocellatus]|uniref:Vitamin B12-dependent ribonucleotide reductase n=1 Tax=Plakobranchus ocellatus TaxID=259542 RepID=A0AAV4C708_9GAST|nr:vitamin B12-dependent ribonucleotide reductase [Plakobranchus ocellatus]